MSEPYIVVLTGTPDECHRLADLTGVEAFREAVPLTDAVHRLASFLSTSERYKHFPSDNLVGRAARALEAALGADAAGESERPDA